MDTYIPLPFTTKKLSQYCYAAWSLFTLRYHNNAQASCINPR